MCKGAACAAFHAQEHIVFVEKLVGTTGFEPATPTPPAAVCGLPPVSGPLTLDKRVADSPDFPAG